MPDLDGMLSLRSIRGMQLFNYWRCMYASNNCMHASANDTYMQQGWKHALLRHFWLLWKDQLWVVCSKFSSIYSCYPLAGILLQTTHCWPVVAVENAVNVCAFVPDTLALTHYAIIWRIYESLVIYVLIPLWSVLQIEWRESVTVEMWCPIIDGIQLLMLRHTSR